MIFRKEVRKVTTKMKLTIRNDSIYVDGYVTAVERPSRVIREYGKVFQEVVAAGAFERALKRNDNVKVLLNHRESRELSSTKQGFELREDNIGLRAQGVIDDPEIVKDAKEGKLIGWSFGFRVMPNGDTWDKVDESIEKRTLHEIYLDEVSILDSSKVPAYFGTSIETRDGEDRMYEIRGFECEVERQDDTYDNSMFENRIKRLKLED